MRNLFRSVGVYTASNLLSASIPFLLLPILTRYLSTTDYGIVAMFQVLTGVVGPFVGLSVQGAIARQYYERDRVDLPAYISSALLLLFGSSLVVAALLASLAGPIEALAGFPRDYLWAVLAYSVGQFFFLVVLTLWQVRVKPFAYGLYQVLKTLLDAFLSIYFVVTLNLGWQGRIEGQVIALGVFALLGLVILARNGWLKPHVRLSYLQNALHFGLPLIPHTFGAWAIQMTDRLLVKNMVGLEQTGIYFAGVQIGMVVLILQDSFNKAWVPYFYERLKRGEPADKVKLVRFTYVYDAVLLTGTLIFALSAPFLVRVFLGDAFAASGKFVLWIAIGYAFNGMYKMVSNYFFFAERTQPLAWLTFFTAVANLGFSYWLIKLNGAVGAAQGSALAFLLTFVLTWSLANRIYPMPWNILWRKAFWNSSR